MDGKRAISLLIALAMLFSSFGMAGVMAAPPAHHPPAAEAMAGHCATMDAPAGTDRPAGKMGADCAIACSALAPSAGPCAEPLRAEAAPAFAGAPAFHRGLRPESDPPPPRAA